MEYSVEDSKYDATRSLYPNTAQVSLDQDGNPHAFDDNNAPISVDNAAVAALAQQLYDAEVVKDQNRTANIASAIQKIATAAGLTADEQTAFFGG